MTQSTEQERAEFEAAIRATMHDAGEDHIAERLERWPDGAYKDRATGYAWWGYQQAARRAPAAPVPHFNHSAKRKLNYLLEAGETITGYAFQNKDGRRGSIDCHGFVAWWHDAAAPRPPVQQVTPEMIEAALEAYMPFGDMELAIQSALSAAPQSPKAAPAQRPEPWGHCVGGNVFVSRNLPAHIKPMVDSGEFKDIKLYTEQQVRELLASHGIKITP